MFKKLFLLSIVLSMVWGCATMRANPEGKLTTLPYSSEIDPNSFYDFKAVSMDYVPTPLGMGVMYLLKNPDPDGTPKVACLVMVDNELVAYGYDKDGETVVYTLNPDKTKFIRYISEKKEGV